MNLRINGQPVDSYEPTANYSPIVVLPVRFTPSPTHPDGNRKTRRARRGKSP